MSATKLVTVFGGSGFLGRYVVRDLAKAGCRVRVAVRRPERAYFLQPLGELGQICAVQANVRNRDSVEHAARGADWIVNLVGILSPRGRQKFDAVHAQGAANIAECTALAGAGRLVHVSAIGADSHSASGYARSKAAGEAAVFAAMPQAVVLRPSIVFGPEDDFFNRFAAMARLSPVLPLIGGGGTKFEPVYVGDVAQAVTRAVSGAVPGGVIYELGGPEILSFRALLEMMLVEIRRQRILLPIPFFAAKIMGLVMQTLPGGLLTLDQVKLLQRDNVVSDTARADGRSLVGIGIQPTGLQAVLPGYLQRYRRAGQFDRGRRWG